MEQLFWRLPIKGSIGKGVSLKERPKIGYTRRTEDAGNCFRFFQKRARNQ
ncbi:hypothetical protein ACFC8X_11435 [Enterococcus casseliflavus]|nr:predicted protein [Enterococcus casseliflavus EC30]EEV37435.1 predicted protein [Enterococcus casseliflavus EC10]MCD4962851.1 hypothetical protein [Enterococcus casseliflavus]OJG31854.1 hypothetical protein RU99_GL002247 [Enterococcus casseliflavus]